MASFSWASMVVLVVKKQTNKQTKNNPSANAGDRGSTPGSGKSLGGGHGNPFQFSCLENTVGRSLVGYGPQGHKESDTTEATAHTTHPSLTTYVDLKFFKKPGGI